MKKIVSTLVFIFFLSSFCYAQSIKYDIPQANLEWIEINSTHFILRVTEKDLILSTITLTALNEGYSILGEIFDCYPPDKIIAEIYPSADTFQIGSGLTPQEIERSGAIGICRFGKIMVISPRCLVYGYRWLDAIVHEYVHYLISFLSNYNCPIWLHEGIAKHYEVIWREKNPTPLKLSEQTLLHKAIKEDKLISFKGMEPSFVNLANQEEVSLSFAEVNLAIGYLCQKYQQPVISKILITLSTGCDLNQALQIVLGISQQEFENEFFSYLKERQFEYVKDIKILKVKLKKDEEFGEEFITSQIADYIHLGDKFRQKGNFYLALQKYQSAREKDPTNPMIFSKLAKTYLAMREYEKGEEILLEGIRLNPDYAILYVDLGNLYFEQEKYQLARDSYEEAMQINPFNPLVQQRIEIINKILR